MRVEGEKEDLFDEGGDARTGRTSRTQELFGADARSLMESMKDRSGGSRW